MGKLKCEMCNSNDFVKENGFFVCQSCGCKYSLEEARKLMNESVSTPNTNKNTSTVNQEESLEKLHTLATKALLNLDTERVKNYCYKAEEIEPENPKTRIIEFLVQVYETEYESQDSTLKSEIQSIFDLFEKVSKENLQNYISLVCSSTVICSNFYSLLKDQILEKYNKELEKCESKIEKIREDNAKFELEDTFFEDLGGVYTRERYVEREFIKKEFMKERSDADKNLDNIKNKIKVIYTKISIIELGLINNLEKMVKDINNYLKKSEQKERYQKYWEEHKQEKEELEKELNQLNEELSNLKPNYTETIEKREAEVAKLKKELEADTPEEIVSFNQNKIVVDLKNNLKSLKTTLFSEFRNRKAIEELNEKIKDEEKKQYELRAVAEKSRASLNEEIEKKISEASLYNQPIVDRYSEIQKRISDINEEFHKER